MPQTSRDRNSSPARRERRRRTHQRIDSSGDPQPRAPRSSSRQRRRRDEWSRSPSPPLEGSPSKSRPKPSYQPRSQSQQHSRSRRPSESAYTKSSSTPLSSAHLAQLDQLNQQRDREWDDDIDDRPRRPQRQREYDDDQPPRQKRRREHNDEAARFARNEKDRERARERRRDEHRERKRRRGEQDKAAALAAAAADGYEYAPSPRRASSARRRERRVVSGQKLERGDGEYYSEKRAYRDDVRRRDGRSEFSEEELARRKKKRKYIYIAIGIAVLLLIIIIPVAVVTSRKQSNSSNSSSDDDSGSSQPNNSNLNGISPSSIPQWAQGGYLDPFDWYTTLDFNVTFTDHTVGGLYVMGLNSTWDDNTQANPETPKINQKWQYGTTPIRGMNLGGWLSIEPFISPSLFDGYSTSDNIVDEWTLTASMGATMAKSTLEEHYATWVSEQDFADIAAAGLDHVRIPYSYWAVKTYDGDPYVPQISWRYLLRGIEWARKHGLRVNLDLHALPGSQNGMNHSGKQGLIGWLNGTDGTLNGDRSIALHAQLSEFFAQPRYKNIIALYGLANEPRMTFLDDATVMQWSQNAINTIRAHGYNNMIVVGDGFYGLDKWQGQLQNQNVVLDAHQYVIFNPQQIVFNHSAKMNYACAGWTAQARESVNTNTGFGPTIFGEWSQADTDCATYLNNVGVGSRWEGTLNLLDAPGPVEVGASIDSVLNPTCPTANNPRCDCTPANADPSSYSDEYNEWLLQFAEAQMHSFEYGWGWFYWTWKTESAAQWSYQTALAAGIMPANARKRSFDCSQSISDYDALGLPEYY